MKTVLAYDLGGSALRAALIDAQVLDLIRELHAQGVTIIIIISHNMEDVLAVAN